MPTADSEAKSAHQSTLWAYVFFLGVVAIAIALRTPELASKGLWLDEAYSVVMAGLPIRGMLDQLNRNATPPLYYLCLAPWIRLFGSSEAAARALSVVFSVGGIALCGMLAFRFFSLRIASVVTLMLAFTPMHIYYAQEARMYALLSLLGTALVFASLEYLARGSRLSLLLAALLSLLMLLTHTVAAWFVLGVNVAFMAICRDRRKLWYWLAAQSFAGLCYLPSLLLTLQKAADQRDVLAWFIPYWKARSVLGHFMTSIGTFVLGDYPPYLAIPSPLATAPFLRGGALLLLCYGLYRWRHSPGAQFVAVTFFVAMFASLGYSALYHPTHIEGRTDQAYLPLFVLLLALGVADLRPRWLEGAVLVIGMVGSLVILQIYHDYPVKNDSRNYLWELQGNLEPGDIVVTTGLTWAEATYYLGRWSAPVTILPFPKAVEEHPGYLNYKEMMKNPARLYADAEEIAQICQKTLGPDNAIYLLYLRPLNVNGIVAERLIRSFPNVIQIGMQPFRQSVLGHPVRIIRLQAEMPGFGFYP